MNDTKLDLVRGSLIGGAAGDALGYPVEFSSYRRIVAEYGERGITEYRLTHGVAEISDDTQMTLFTANGMLMGQTRGCMRGIGAPLETYVIYAYKDWYYTQTKTYELMTGPEDNIPLHRVTWLSDVPELYARRAPGNTCLSAIAANIDGDTPQNNSKGCGGVMRVAPWPLFNACHYAFHYSTEEIDVAGGEIARLTHKHPLGWMPAIVLTHIIYRLVDDTPLAGLDKPAARKAFADIVREALQLLPELKVTHPASEEAWDTERPLGEVFPKDVEYQSKLMELALSLADNDRSDIENIDRLGEGWVGEETLAIAVYAVARHIDSFEDTLIAAVNHDGDSDSTGAVAGNIIGAIVGYESIPLKFKEHLELHNVILAIADDLWQGCIIGEYSSLNTPERQQWYNRYCKMKAAGI